MQSEASLSILHELLGIIRETAERAGCSEREVLGRIRAKIVGEPAAEGSAELKGFVRRLQRMRQARNDVLGAPLCRDPVWDMLIALYLARMEERPISISGLCAAANTPATTALRHFERMRRHGMVDLQDDTSDQRRSWVALREETKQRFERLARELKDAC
jgi:hypothetical protein